MLSCDNCTRLQAELDDVRAALLDHKNAVERLQDEGAMAMAERLGINPKLATWKECADVAYHRYICSQQERAAQ